MGEYTRGRSRTGWKTGERSYSVYVSLTVSQVICLFMLVMCFCSFGELLAPNKTLNKNDQYLGHWKDGKMHGLGTYRCV